MNETPDGTEPLGEAPEIPFTEAWIQVRRSEHNAAALALYELTQLHRKTGTACLHCGTTWPCETGRILNDRGVA